MREIWDSRKRARNSLFGAWDRARVGEFINALGRLICENENLFVFNIARVVEVVGTDEMSRVRRVTKEEAYLNLVLYVVDSPAAACDRPG